MTFGERIDIERATLALSMRLPERYPVFRQIPVASRNPSPRRVSANSTAARASEGNTISHQ